ncbi:MAG: hypothetical protein HQK54_15765 [Oligoflexales bacterium]|nr:hypothetical protein [Oligoflexales bacterium]
MFKKFVILSVIVLFFCPTQIEAGYARWFFRLLPAGITKLDDIAAKPVKEVADIAMDRGKVFSLQWVDVILGPEKAKYIEVKPDFPPIEQFGYLEAMDHYFYGLAKNGYLKTLDDAKVNPADYIKNTYNKGLSELKKPNRCQGMDCGNIYKLPDEEANEDYVNRLKNDVFAKDDIQVKLPSCLKKGGGSSCGTTGNSNVDLEELFKCKTR